MSHSISRNAVPSPGERIANALSAPAGRLLLVGVFAVAELMLVFESALTPLTRLRRM